MGKNAGFSKIKVDVDMAHPISGAMQKARSNNTKQIDEKQKTPDGGITPPLPFYLLRVTSEKSAALSWIINKICSNADSGFEEIDDPELAALCERLDVFEHFKNLATFGNLFLEKLKRVGTKETGARTYNLDVILTETCQLKQKEGKWKEKLELIQKHETKVATWGPDDFIHVKRPSLSNKYYGDTVFRECIDSILLLYYIERVYMKLFENGFIEPTLLVDEENNLTQDQRDSITTFLKDYFRGVDNGFEVGIIGGKIKKVELTSKVDHNSFIALKKEIKEDIAIGLNLPIDLLTKSPNRSTKESSMEDLNTHVVKPLQKRYVRQLRESLRGEFGDAVDQIQLKALDTKNQEEISKVVDRLTRGGIISRDEGREMFGLETTGNPEMQEMKVYSGTAVEKDEDAEIVEEEVTKLMKKTWRL